MGILYGEFCSVVDVLRRKRLLLAGRVPCNFVFLLSLKHNYSITARGPVDDQVHLKELFFSSRLPIWKRDLSEHDHDPEITLGTTQVIFPGNEAVYFCIR